MLNQHRLIRSSVGTCSRSTSIHEKGLPDGPGLEVRIATLGLACGARRQVRSTASSRNAYAISLSVRLVVPRLTCC